MERLGSWLASRPVRMVGLVLAWTHCMVAVGCLSQNSSYVWLCEKLLLPVLLVSGLVAVLEALSVAANGQPSPICLLDGLLVFALLVMRKDMLTAIASMVEFPPEHAAKLALGPSTAAALSLLRAWRVLDAVMLADGASRATEQVLREQARASAMAVRRMERQLEDASSRWRHAAAARAAAEQDVDRERRRAEEAREEATLLREALVMAAREQEAVMGG